MEFPPARKKEHLKIRNDPAAFNSELCIHHVHTDPWASEPDAALPQHWSNTDDTLHLRAGGIGITSMLLPFSSTSLCPSFLEDPTHLSSQILTWYILLNRAVVMRTQQGLAPLLNIILTRHMETLIRGWRKRDLAKLPNADANPWLWSHCVWSQGTAWTKATLSLMK